MMLYKVQVLQDLSDLGKQKRFEFRANVCNENDDFADRLVFSDEATFQSVLQDNIDNFILLLDGVPSHWSAYVRDYFDDHRLQHATYPMFTQKSSPNTLRFLPVRRNVGQRGRSEKRPESVTDWNSAAQSRLHGRSKKENISR
ncbi:hypothetical protein NPIL_149071 [Nephila pilipes]|uniref:Uncharacterized protein n=1 Tax=Nephila pilipes TaxID=299642 RepID=A0A8X6QQN4_NEPPI|nr:hypothetical protein NPIL_149071 [Nephila pilipes]